MQRFITSSLFRSTRPLLPYYSIPRYHSNMSAPGAAETDTQAEKAASETGITPESLSNALKEKIEANHVEIEDMSGMLSYSRAHPAKLRQS